MCGMQDLPGKGLHRTPVRPEQGVRKLQFGLLLIRQPEHRGQALIPFPRSGLEDRNLSGAVEKQMAGGCRLPRDRMDDLPLGQTFQQQMFPADPCGGTRTPLRTDIIPYLQKFRMHKIRPLFRRYVNCQDFTCPKMVVYKESIVFRIN